MQPYSDPFDSANNPSSFVNDLWGQLSLEAWYCVLAKGYGRAPFDPNTHNLKDRRTAIDLTVEPLPEQNITNPNVCMRHMIVESDAWRNITLKSIKALGINDVRQINGCWVRILPTPNGESYEKNGKTYESTDFAIVKIFANEAECRTDYLAETSGGMMTAAATQATTHPTTSQFSPDKTNPEWEIAHKFLEFFVKSACLGQTDITVIRATVAANIAGQPVVSKYFTADSPEVTELISQNMGG